MSAETVYDKMESAESLEEARKIYEGYKHSWIKPFIHALAVLERVDLFRAEIRVNGVDSTNTLDSVQNRSALASFVAKHADASLELMPEVRVAIQEAKIKGAKIILGRPELMMSFRGRLERIGVNEADISRLLGEREVSYVPGSPSLRRRTSSGTQESGFVSLVRDSEGAGSRSCCFC